MSALLLLVGLLCAAPCAREGNRLWWVELELRGPLEGVRVPAGPWGETRLTGTLLAGETRRLAVPLAWLAPLGAGELADVALPGVAVEGRGTATVLGWVAPQPHAELARRAGALLGRPRPPVAAGAVRPGAAELFLLGGAGLLSLGILRRPRASGALVAAAAVALAALGARRAPDVPEVELVEAEVGRAEALQVRSAPGVLELLRGATRLEVVPPRTPLTLELPLAGDAPARVRAPLARGPRASLHALAPVATPPLHAAENAWRALARAWIRTPAGDWSHRGPWPLGAALPAGSDPGPPPPGWLAAGLPPGRGVLVGKTDDGVWIRMVGFR